AAIAADPSQPISQLPILVPGERERLLALAEGAPRSEAAALAPARPLVRDGSADTAQDATLAELFERQAAATPEATALVDGDTTLGYAELNRQANRLARRLRTLGVGPDVLVGLCLQRSARSIVAMLATLKAGGAYLPLDPEYPPERIAFMLHDSAAPVVLTERALRPLLPQDADARVLCLDEDGPAADARGETVDDEANLPALAGPQHLAYVIYT